MIEQLGRLENQPYVYNSLICVFLYESNITLTPSISCFVFLRLLYHMLPVSLNCLFLITLWYSLTFIHLVYPMLPVSLDCPFLIVPSVFSNVYLFLGLVHPMLPVSLNCPYLIVPSVFSNVYLFLFLVYPMLPVSLWIAHNWLPLWYSLTLICSCVMYTICCQFLSGLSIFDCPFGIL